MLGSGPPGPSSWPASHLVVAGTGVGLVGCALAAGPSGSMRSVRYRSNTLLSARIPKNTFSWSSIIWGGRALGDLHSTVEAPPLSTATGLSLLLQAQGHCHASKPLPRTHLSPMTQAALAPVLHTKPGPQPAHLVMEAFSLELLQELLLLLGLPGVSLGAVVSHKDIVPLLRGLGLEEGGVGLGWGWHRAQAKGGT